MNNDSDIPIQHKGESPKDYFLRLNDYQNQLKINSEIEKEILRRDRRIRSLVEQEIIKQSVKQVFNEKYHSRAYIKNKRGPRYYHIPKNLWMLLLFAPLYLLLTILHQDWIRKKEPEYQEIPVYRMNKR